METEDKYQLIVMRTKYLKNTLDLTKKIADQAHEMFMKYLNVKMGVEQKPEPTKQETQVTTTEFKQEEIPRQPTTEEGKNSTEERIHVEKEEKDGNLKKVFRKIALQIHPDKLEKFSDFEKQLKTKLFEKARDAFQKNDYYAMVEVAEQLKIDLPPPTQEQMRTMKKTNKSLEKEIDVLKGLWYGDGIMPTKKMKRKIMDRYIDYLKKNNTGT